VLVPLTVVAPLFLCQYRVDRLAFDETQRRRAAQMIHRYRHLIPDYGEKSNERKQDRLTVKGIFEHIKID
jgi:hypothetical protein